MENYNYNIENIIKIWQNLRENQRKLRTYAVLLQAGRSLIVIGRLPKENEKKITTPKQNTPVTPRILLQLNTKRDVSINYVKVEISYQLTKFKESPETSVTRVTHRRIKTTEISPCFH